MLSQHGSSHRLPKVLVASGSNFTTRNIFGICGQLLQVFALTANLPGLSSLSRRTVSCSDAIRDVRVVDI